MVKVGTSGFSYRSWIGKIYPEGIKPRDMLLFYAKTFPAVEINATFYHNPKEKTLQRWHGIFVETGLIFILKAHRIFTHIRTYSETEIENYIGTLKGYMKDALGGLLWQFPHSFKPSEENIAYISTIASLLEKHNIPLFIELRNRLWHDKPLPNLIIPVSFHMVAKSRYMHTPPQWLQRNTVYIRLHGYGRKYGGSYPEPYLEKLCQDVKDKDGFVFFNNDANGFAPLNALTLMNCLTSQ